MTPAGQVFFLATAAALVALLVWVRRLGVAPPAPPAPHELDEAEMLAAVVAHMGKCPGCISLTGKLREAVTEAERAKLDRDAIVAELVSPASDTMGRPSPCGRFSVGPRVLARWSKGGSA